MVFTTGRNPSVRRTELVPEAALGFKTLEGVTLRKTATTVASSK